MELTSRRRLGAIARLLAPLSAVLAGLLAGGIGFIEVVLLPFWRGSSPAEFRQWFTPSMSRRTTNPPQEHLTDAETRSLLDRCARWHHLRVALGMIATTAAALASRQRQVSLDEK